MIAKIGVQREMTRAVSALIALVYAVMAPAQLRAQAIPCPPVAEAPYQLCQGDVKPERLPGTLFNLVNAMQRNGITSGQARLRLLVDTSARGTINSVEVLSATTEAFANFVKDEWQQHRYAPARRAGLNVPVVMEEIVLAGIGPFPLHLVNLVPRFDTTSDGTARTTVGDTPLDSAAAATLSVADFINAQGAVLATIARHPTLSGADSAREIVACVTFAAAGVPIAKALQAMSTSRVRLTTAARCPYTYQKMAAHVGPGGKSDEPPRPVGYIDPVIIKFDQVSAWNANVVYFSALASRGTMSIPHFCRVQRIHDEWIGVCMQGAPRIY